MIVPDGITPDVGWRSWNVVNGILHSLNYDAAWPLKTALVAECSHPPRQKYVPKRYGRIVPVGHAHEGVAQAHGYSVVLQRVFAFETGGLGPLEIEPPPVQLPEGWGYELEEVPMEVPDEYCRCGIYALKDKAELLRSPYLVSGKAAIGAVSLWGKVIPADKGYRAQYAYPLFLYTDEALLDYGVPTRPLSDLGEGLQSVVKTIVQIPRKTRRR